MYGGLLAVKVERHQAVGERGQLRFDLEGVRDESIMRVGEREGEPVKVSRVKMVVSKESSIQGRGLMRGCVVFG